MSGVSRGPTRLIYSPGNRVLGAILHDQRGLRAVCVAGASAIQIEAIMDALNSNLQAIRSPDLGITP
jgi:hypothetical protein